jgi:hypothetical protein
MHSTNLSNFYKSPKVILALILSAFFLKGVFLVSSYPIFGGQDESRHYSTIQYLTEPKKKDWELKKMPDKHDEDNLETYGFSEEIQKTATATDTNIIRGELFNTINFSDDYVKKNEASINSLQWKPYNFSLKPEIVPSSIYHPAISKIEKLLSSQSILTRFYFIRIISVMLGALAVFFFYLTAKTIGFSEKNSLLLTAIIAFQPKFSSYGTYITYDALLIPLFFLFTLAVVMALKNGLNWKNFVLLLFSATLGFLTKLTGLVLLAVFASLIAYFLYQKVTTKSKSIRYATYVFCMLIFIFLATYADIGNYLSSTGKSPTQIFNSLNNYLDKSFTPGRFALSARTYWNVPDEAISLIKWLEIISLTGLGFFFFSKKIKFDFLPEKKYIVFFVLMILALQLEIRAADWSMFSRSGTLDLGTPGRYFLPNLGAHIILVFTGLGVIFAFFKRENYFEKSLIIGLLSMFYFSLYLLFNGLILRYYL